jgi:hypothetical protein
MRSFISTRTGAAWRASSKRGPRLMHALRPWCCIQSLAYIAAKGNIACANQEVKASYGDFYLHHDWSCLACLSKGGGGVCLCD